MEGAEVTPPIVDEVTPPIVDEAPTGLPSDEGITAGNALAEEGKKFGDKFASTDDMLKHIKELEDFKSNTNRDAANLTAEEIAANEANSANATKVEAQQTLIDTELYPEFMKNGMVITPEMEAKAVEAGIDARDLKLGAYELKENMQSGFTVTGGQENYTAMMEWGKVNLTGAEKTAFDEQLHGGMSKIVIEGLWNRFSKSEGFVKDDAGRVRGNPSPHGVQGYADRKSLYKDKSYVESRAGKNDTVAMAQYRAKLKATPDSVLGISR